MSGDSRVLLEGSLQKPLVGEAIGCLGALALIPLVAVAVNLFVGEAGLPREVRGTTPWFGAAAVLFGAITAVVWAKTRVRLTVVERDGERYVEVYDSGAPLVLKGPFDVRYGWAWVPMPQVGRVPLLVVGLYEDDRLVLALSEQRGALYTPPPDWPQDYALGGGPAQAAYTVGGMGFVPELVELARER